MQVTNLCLELKNGINMNTYKTIFLSVQKFFLQKMDTLSEVNFIVCLPLNLT